MLPLLSPYNFFLPEGVAILISLEIHSSMFGLTFRYSSINEAQNEHLDSKKWL